VSEAALPQLVENLFRHRYGRMVAGLCRVLGSERLDLVEDVVQEAMLRALRVWPVEGVPDQPDAWVFRVARNLALDSLRRRKVAQRVEGELARWAAATGEGGEVQEGIADDTLRMMFTCAHPSVPAETRVPLVLKTVGGFGVSEIAAALLQKEGTIAQRLTRAKARLQGELVRFEVPPARELPERLQLVLQVLYLMFNEGYRAHRGRELVRQDLVEESVRLCALLLEDPATARPEVHALLALMLLLGARLPARTDEAGELLTLREQDRRRWDQDWLRCGFFHFRRSIGGEAITAYHCEAAIASIHAAAPDYASTDWRLVLAEYDRLQAIAPSPVVKLNRVVAVAKVHGPAAGLEAMRELHDDAALADYFLLPATAAQLSWEVGDHDAAVLWLERALALPSSEPEQRLLRRRLDACRRGERPPAW
jgi:RNA polymerase sigma-70 factor (ECF subfamily)